MVIKEVGQKWHALGPLLLLCSTSDQPPVKKQKEL